MFVGWTSSARSTVENSLLTHLQNVSDVQTIPCCTWSKIPYSAGIGEPWGSKLTPRSLSVSQCGWRYGYLIFQLSTNPASEERRMDMSMSYSKVKALSYSDEACLKWEIVAEMWELKSTAAWIDLQCTIYCITCWLWVEVTELYEQ